MIRWMRPLFALLIVVAIASVGRGADLDTPAPSGRIVVQFTADADHADQIRVASLVGAAATPRVAPNLLRQVAAKSVGSSPALDALARYVQFDADHLSDDRLRRLVAGLGHDPAVSVAFLEPRAVPAALGFDAITGRGPADAGRVEAGLRTDDLTEWQGYMWEAPMGIGAWNVHPEPGARGGSVRIIDIEGAWLWAHEDLPEPFADLGEHIDDLSWRNHGTAVMGEMVGQDNGYGVTGIVPDAQVGNASIGSQSVPAALLAAAAAMEAGDLILIELHAPGPNATGDGQFGYVPMEFWPDNFDAIRAVTDMGLIVVEAAGNGQQDLDDAVYQGFFDRDVRDSGAIMVGATSGSGLNPAWFTNHGTRVDLCGWGLNVATCAYGDLQGGDDETLWYTVAFSGTSSASPIVTGAVASLQGMAEATLGLTLDAFLAREILSQTGTATTGPEIIGPRPDLVAARAMLLDTGVGFVVGTVSDATGTPITDAVVGRLTEGSHITTGVDGRYRLGLLPGDHVLTAESYFHVPVALPVIIPAGAETTLDITLELRELHTLSGTVADTAGVALEGVVMELLGEPVPTTLTDGSGAYEFAPIPYQDELLVQAGGLPGYGGQVAVLVPIGIPDLDKSLTDLRLPTVTYDFEDGPQGWEAYGGLWTLGDPATTPMGPGHAFDGVQCWGVGLDGGGYPDDTWSELWSPVFHDADHEGDVLTLSLHYWSGTEAGFDGVHIVLDPGTPEELVLVPHGGYTDPVMGGLNHLSGWSGDSGGWRTAVFNISDQLEADTWQLAIRFGSDQSVTTEGFLIDGVTIDAYEYPTAVEPTPVPMAALNAYPNPFNPQVTLSWSLPAAGRLDLSVYDLRGRLVSTLLRGQAVAASGHTNWNGTDQTGRAVASGVYLVQARSHDGHTARRRITLTR